MSTDTPTAAAQELVPPVPADRFRSTDEAEEANAEATATWLAGQPKPGDGE